MSMELGQKVEASAYLVRKTLTGGGLGWGFARKVWQRAVFPAPATGVLVGLRTISDGHRVNLGDEGVAYKATAHQRAALVSFGLRSAPRLVVLADLKTLTN
jgi:hypothetical protein